MFSNYLFFPSNRNRFERKWIWQWLILFITLISHFKPVSSVLVNWHQRKFWWFKESTSHSRAGQCHVDLSPVREERPQHLGPCHCRPTWLLPPALLQSPPAPCPAHGVPWPRPLLPTALSAWMLPTPPLPSLTFSDSRSQVKALTKKSSYLLKVLCYTFLWIPSFSGSTEFNF